MRFLFRAAYLHPLFYDQMTNRIVQFAGSRKKMATVNIIFQVVNRELTLLLTLPQ